MNANKKSKYVNVAMVADNNYAPWTAVTLQSLFSHNPSLKFHIYLLTCNFNKDNQDKFHQLFQYKENQGHLFTLIEMDETLLNPYDGICPWPKYVYMKLFIPTLLPADINKVIYLDSDMYIANEISELVNLDLGNYALAGVEDMTSCIAHKKRIGIPMSCLYINSGLMVINMQMWRDVANKDLFSKTVKELLEITSELNEQDVISYIFQNQILGLHLRFNITNVCYGIRKYILPQQHKQLREAFKFPVIIHFADYRKPWIPENFHIYKKSYLKVLAHTPYAFKMKEMNVTNRAKWLYCKFKYSITSLYDKLIYGA